jgi:hypothetical protein
MTLCQLQEAHTFWDGGASILDRTHQTTGNTFEIQDRELDELDPWSGILSAAMLATRATSHSTLDATLSQMLFGQDDMLNTPFKTDWALIRQHEQKSILHNNNKKRISPGASMCTALLAITSH